MFLLFGLRGILRKCWGRGENLIGCIGSGKFVRDRDVCLMVVDENVHFF